MQKSTRGYEGWWHVHTLRQASRSGDQLVDSGAHWTEAMHCLVLWKYIMMPIRLLGKAALLTGPTSPAQGHL